MVPGAVVVTGKEFKVRLVVPKAVCKCMLWQYLGACVHAPFIVIITGNGKCKQRQR